LELKLILVKMVWCFGWELRDQVRGVDYERDARLLSQRKPVLGLELCLWQKGWNTEGVHAA